VDFANKVCYPLRAPTTFACALYSTGASAVLRKRRVAMLLSLGAKGRRARAVFVSIAGGCLSVQDDTTIICEMI